MDESRLFEWLMDKPHPKINLILDQLRANNNVNWNEKNILTAFFWSTSPEGHEYWLEVYTWYITNQ